MNGFALPAAAAPVAGGFGKAPAAGGFGAPAPAAGGFGAAPAAGGFGKAPAAGGFGAPAPAAGGFGAPAAGGFGAPAPGGFGAAAPLAGGFKAPGFGGGGFGGGGFGAAPAAAPAAAAVYNPDLSMADLCRQATIGRYMMQLDKAYNATSAECKFRTFVFNMCPQGTNVRNDRYAYELLGGTGSFPEGQWIDASRENPDPAHMAPAPLHFMAGLVKRVDKQSEATALLHKKADSVAEKAERLRQLNLENNNAYRKVKEKAAMLERQSLLTYSRVETLRQRNLPLGEERHKLAERAAWLKAQLDAPGSFKAALAELEPYIGCGPVGGADVAGTIDPSVLSTWSKFLSQMEVGITRLQVTVDADRADIKAMLTYEEDSLRRV